MINIKYLQKVQEREDQFEFNFFDIPSFKNIILKQNYYFAFIK